MTTPAKPALPELPKQALLHTQMPDHHWYGHVYGYTVDQMREYARAAIAAAVAEVRGVPGGLTEMMRHVRRVQAHVQDWWAWYGDADVLLRNQLPLPPSRSPQILEDLDAAIAAATPSPTEPAMPAERVALSDESIEAIIERHAGGCDWSDDEHESAVSLIRSVIAELNGITPAQGKGEQG